MINRFWPCFFSGMPFEGQHGALHENSLWPDHHGDEEMHLDHIDVRKPPVQHTIITDEVHGHWCATTSKLMNSLGSFVEWMCYVQPDGWTWLWMSVLSISTFCTRLKYLHATATWWIVFFVCVCDVSWGFCSLNHGKKHHVSMFLRTPMFI